MEEVPSTLENLRENHRYSLFVGGAIVIALLLVGVSLWLYRASGTLQLDLSRPGYQSVRDQAQGDQQYNGFDATGPINKSTTTDFQSLYNEEIKRVTTGTNFGGDPLSDTALFGADSSQD
jgi:hypothetical protein